MMSLFAHDPISYAVPEPRLAHLATQLAEILALVQLESRGRPMEVDGFRLRDPGQWVTHETNTAMNALTPISSVCNSRCHFCFEENVPYARERSLMSIAEARTRLKYYAPERGTALFPSNRNHMETFVHPQALDIIELARAREPGKVFWITTNGSYFTEPVVQRLARLKPLIFKLSLNAAEPTVNQALMHTGERTAIAIEAPRMLQKYRLPFVGGIVAWPTLTHADIEKTARYLAECDAYSVRIRLPLTHRWLNEQLDVDFHAHWREIAALARRLRPELPVPLIVEPPLFWLDAIVPEVDGVIRNSPAHRAGLRAGDLMRRIEGRPVRTRIESEAILDQCHLEGRRRVEVTVARNGELLDMTLEESSPGEDTYPYSADGLFRGENYGVLHIEDFRLNHVQRVIEAIERHAARRVLLFSSVLMAPIFETIVAGVPEFAARLESVQLCLDVIKDNSFGGNYDVMDSRVVDDYRRVIRRRLSDGYRFDMILLPEAFGSPWGTDIYGASAADLCVEFGIPVERIEWPLVYGRDV